MYRLENGASFWMGEVNDNAYPEATLAIRWGTLGTAGESKETRFKGTWDEGFESAKAELKKLMDAKKAEGYADKGIWEEPEPPKPPKPKAARPEEVEPSLRAYLMNLAVCAWGRADESLDADNYGDGKDAGELDDLASSYWDADYKWLFLTAYYAIDETHRKSAPVRKLVDEAETIFCAEFIKQPDHVKLGATDQESFLTGQMIFSGSKVVSLKPTFDPSVKTKAAKDKLAR